MPREDLDGYSRDLTTSAPAAAADDSIPGDPGPDEALESPDLALPLAEPAADAPADECTECPAPLPLSMGDAGPAPVASGRAGADPAEADAVPIASGVDAEPSPCAPGALLSPGERCFALETELAPWSEARAACRARGTGWDLASVDGPDENAWLAGLMAGIDDAWLGGTDEETEGSWLWVVDDQPFWTGTGADGSAAPGAYVNWNAGPNPEPNGRGASDCLRLRSDGGWADIECDTEFAALCEGPPL